MEERKKGGKGERGKGGKGERGEQSSIESKSEEIVNKRLFPLFLPSSVNL